MREIRVGGRIVPETLCRARLFRVCVNCRHSPTVIPAKAGIHLDFQAARARKKMDPGFRRDDGQGSLSHGRRLQHRFL
jgi:hypothetical protein